MPHPKVLARGLLLLSLLVALLAAPGVFSSAPADQPASSVVSLTAATGATPEYAGGAKVLRPQAAPPASCSNGVLVNWTFDTGTLSPDEGLGTIGFQPGILGPVQPFPAGNGGGSSAGFVNWSSTTTFDPARYLEFFVSTVDWTGIQLSFDYFAETDAPTLLDVYYSTNGGANYTLLQSGVALAANAWSPLSFNFLPGAGMEDNSGARFRLYPYSAATTTSMLLLDNLRVLGACVPTPTPTTIPPTPTRTPLGFHPRLMINEVGWAGTSADPAAQWIELYNPTGQPVELDDGWSLDTPTGHVLVDLRGTVGPGGYFLLVAGGSAAATSVPTPGTDDCLVFDRDDVIIDQVFTGSLSTAGEIVYLINPTNTIEDSADRTGKAWPAGSTSGPRSMERSGVIADTTPGAWFTFEGSTASTPRDCSGSRVRGTPRAANWAITVTATPKPSAVPPKPPTPRPPTPFAHMVINEFLPRAGTDWNGDALVNVYDEFIEVKNLGPIDVDLAGWKLDDDATRGSPAYTLPSVKLKPGERAVFYGLTTRILLEDSGDNVRLINPQGAVIDGRTYGVTETLDISHCRIPDGYYWRTACFPTPGLENALTGVAPAPAPIVLGGPASCLLPDTAPEPFWLAECEAYGEDMWDRAFWDELPPTVIIVHGTHTKWKTYIE